MCMVNSTSIETSYREMAGTEGKDSGAFLPPGITREIGHFRISDIAATSRVSRAYPEPYSKRPYYRISLFRSRNRAGPAGNMLLFTSPGMPYPSLPAAGEQQYVNDCAFTEDFLLRAPGVPMTIFQSKAGQAFYISDNAGEAILQVFRKMDRALLSDYVYKYDLIRNYLTELIHYGQQLQPEHCTGYGKPGAVRVTARFMELLERQFPVEAPRERLTLRTARDFALRLGIHVNYLNKALKETTGRTTTRIISSRVIAEAILQLRHTDRSISEIAHSLGFEEVAHFSNFFKKHTRSAPVTYRT